MNVELKPRYASNIMKMHSFMDWYACSISLMLVVLQANPTNFLCFKFVPFNVMATKNAKLSVLLTPLI